MAGRLETHTHAGMVKGDVTGVNIGSIVIATVGAIIVIAVVRMLRGSRATI